MGASSPHQRLHIRCLMQELGMSTLTVGSAHVCVAEQAGIQGWTAGDRLDQRLREISDDQARSLAHGLLSSEATV